MKKKLSNNNKNARGWVIFIIITLVFILVVIALLTTNEKQLKEENNRKKESSKLNLYLMNTDKMSFKDQTLNIFKNSEETVRINLYKNLKCKYYDYSNANYEQQCYYEISDDEIILTITDYHTYEKHFKYDKDWKYLSDGDAKYNNTTMDYYKENNIKEILVDPNMFYYTYYPDTGILIESYCDKNYKNYDSSKCNPKSFVVNPDNYNIIDTKGDYDKIKRDSPKYELVSGLRYKSGDNNVIQHIKLDKNNKCNISVEKNGINESQEGKYKNCKYNIFSYDDSNYYLEINTDYVNNSTSTPAMFRYLVMKTKDDIRIFDEIFSPDEKEFKVLIETDEENKLSYLTYVEEITPKYRLHSSYDESSWWGPVNVGSCNGENLDVFLKKLSNQYKIQVYSYNYDGYIIKVSNDKGSSYISLARPYDVAIADSVENYDLNGDKSVVKGLPVSWGEETTDFICDGTIPEN